MDEKKAALVLKNIERMPSLSPTVAKILQVANDPASSANDLNRVISLDPVLAGKVLKLVNSAYFGFSDKVTSTVRAIVMLGLNTIKNLALSTATMEALNLASTGGLNMDAFWQHLLATGVCAKLIAKKIGVHKNFLEDYFLCGLMHDIGKIILNRINPAGYGKVVEAARKSEKPLILYESAVFGINHAEIGQVLGKKWGLQESIINAMSKHHSLEGIPQEHRLIVCTIFISNNYCKEIGAGFGGNLYIEKISDDIYKEVGITRDVLENLEGYIVEGVTNASVFLQNAQ